MPLERRRYDITPAEMLDLARTAVDTVVAELQSRTAELLPDQLSRLEQVSASLAKTVTEVAESSYRAQMETVRAGLDAVRDDLSGAMVQHDARLVQAVENRLAGYDPAELTRRLPPAVASAVIDGLENALPTIDKGLHEVRELVGELVERGKRSDLSRQNSLDRLDEVLVELRAGLSENVARQHAVLLQVVDEKLSGLRLNELATELPGRIGSVISEAVQRSHDVQAESMHEMAAGLSSSLEAGLTRQRSATSELSATAERMAESVSGFSQVAEDAVTIAFERAQAAQAQRLNTMMRELREAQSEAAADLKASLDGAVQEMRAFQQEQASALASGLDQRLGARVEAVLEPQLQASAELRAALDVVVSELHTARQQDAAAYGAQLGTLRESLDAASASQLQSAAELRETLGEVARDLGAAREHEAAEYAARIESLTGELRAATATQAEATLELRDAFGAVVRDVNAANQQGAAAYEEQLENLTEHVESATSAQARAHAELRDAFDVVARELRAGQQQEAELLAGELERRLAERLESLVVPHQESMVDTTRQITDLVTGQAEGVVARLDAVAEDIEQVRSSTEAQRRSQEASLSAATSNLERLSSQIEIQSASHEEALLAQSAAVADALASNAAKVVDALQANASSLSEVVDSSAATLAEALETRSDALVKAVASNAQSLSEAFEARSDALVDALGSNAGRVSEALESRSSALVEALESQSEAQAEALSTTRDHLTSHLSELMETVSPRVSAELAAVLEESRTRQERVEGLIAELAWIVGEQRAGSAGIREDLARALEALPAAIASIQEASLRSEARITDLLARKLQGPDAR